MRINVISLCAVFAACAAPGASDQVVLSLGSGRADDLTRINVLAAEGRAEFQCADDGCIASPLEIERGATGELLNARIGAGPRIVLPREAATALIGTSYQAAEGPASIDAAAVVNALEQLDSSIPSSDAELDSMIGQLERLEEFAIDGTSDGGAALESSVENERASLEAQLLELLDEDPDLGARGDASSAAVALLGRVSELGGLSWNTMRRLAERHSGKLFLFSGIADLASRRCSVVSVGARVLMLGLSLIVIVKVFKVLRAAWAAYAGVVATQGLSWAAIATGIRALMQNDREGIGRLWGVFTGLLSAAGHVVGTVFSIYDIMYIFECGWSWIAGALGMSQAPATTTPPRLQPGAGARR